VLNKVWIIISALVVIAISSCSSTPVSDAEYYKKGMKEGQELARRSDPQASNSQKFIEDYYILDKCKERGTELIEKIKKKKTQKFDESHLRAYEKGCIDGFKATGRWKAYNSGWERGWSFAVGVLSEASFDIQKSCEDYASDVVGQNRAGISRESAELLIDACIDGYRSYYMR
jgi:hypothetical protein